MTSPSPWRKEEILKLIQLYEHHPCLYDAENAFYSNKPARNEALESIKQSLWPKVVTKEEVKQKFTTLRSNFSHELRRVEKKSGGGGKQPYVPSLFWFDAIRYLEPHVKPRKSKPNFNLNLNAESSSSNDHIASRSTATPSKRKSIKQEELLSIMADRPADGGHLAKNRFDRFDLIGQTWANKLRDLPRAQSLLLEKKINDAFFEAEMIAIYSGSSKSPSLNEEPLMSPPAVATSNFELDLEENENRLD